MPRCEYGSEPQRPEKRGSAAPQRRSGMGRQRRGMNAAQKGEGTHERSPATPAGE